jgi:uncharacterized Ntn-hydrolase superfamily protein
MRRLAAASFALLLARALALSPPVPSPSSLRPVHTYSIVARDATTGELGVAVQSHAFSVGSGVTWAEGRRRRRRHAVLHRSRLRPLGLELMRAGRSAPDALKGLIAADEGRDVRQVR